MSESELEKEQEFVISEPHITIKVKDGLNPFAHALQEARNLFADNHDQSGDFLQADHKPLLNNFNQLKELGPHPMLPLQFGGQVSEDKWKRIRMEVEETGEWVTFFARADNLYVRGFENEHGRYELVEKRRCKARKGDDNASGSSMNKVQLPVMECVTQLPYQCVRLHSWGISYGGMFGVNHHLEPNPNDVIEDIFQEISKDAGFAVRAIKKLSAFQQATKSDDEEDAKEDTEAKRMLGGLIFLFFEHVRMNLKEDNLRFVDKTQGWGDACARLLDWRDSDFTYFKTDTPKMQLLKISCPADALHLAHLMMNRNMKHQYFPRKDGQGKGPDGGGGKGPKRGGKGPKEGGSKGKDLKKKDDHERGSGRNIPVLGGMGLDSYGRTRVQILGVEANFSIDWITIWDWHRPQTIYRKDLLDEVQDYDVDKMRPLDLVGPDRPISPYGPIGVNFYQTQDEPATKKRRTEEEGTSDVWIVDNDDHLLQKRDIHGQTDGQKLSVYYMLIPNALEAHVTCVVLLREDRNGYKVSGTIKGCGRYMERGVILFSNQTWNVPGGKRFQIPLMVSNICIPNANGAMLSLDLDLSLQSESSGQIEYIRDIGCHSPFDFKKGFATKEKDYNGHKVEFTVVLHS